MARLVPAYGDLWRASTVSMFELLCRIVVGQQVSTTAARTIHGRLRTRVGGRVNPENLNRLSVEEIASCGLSRQKTASIQDITERTLNGRLRPSQLWRLDDEAVYEQLIAVRGLGPWSVEMVQMFGLGRPDILSTTDLGLIVGAQKLTGSRQRPTPKQFEKLAAPWRPWRTMACLYLWAILNDPTPFEDSK